MKTKTLQERKKDDSADALLSVNNLFVYFRTRSAPIRAVDGVSFDVKNGETAALVGESGCGKSVTAMSLTRLVPAPGYHAGGSILFNGVDTTRIDLSSLQKLRGAEISYIFQEPSSSLNPVFTVGYQVEEALRLHQRELDSREEAVRLLDMVGIAEPGHRMRSYPHELSGGMQQRVMIAMALACRPKLLVADEPTTALDVTVQAQILELLANLQEEFGMAVLLITHNLGIVADMARRVNVMYAGRIVESGLAEEILSTPGHPYTRGLLAAVPRLDSGNRRMAGIPGTVPNPASLPTGCKFHPRCPLATDLCRREEPAEDKISDTHGVKCHYWK
jgi:oligopeptide/dipeptide ABC transporter ATP-binding protein